MPRLGTHAPPRPALLDLGVKSWLLGGCSGSQPGRECGQRLRVPRGSAGDPLNLIQVMLAKGGTVCRAFLPLPGISRLLVYQPATMNYQLIYDRDQRFI